MSRCGAPGVAQARQGTPVEQTLPSHAMTRTAEDNSDAGLTESLAKLKLEELTALSPEVIQRQATINIGRPSCIAPPSASRHPRHR